MITCQEVTEYLMAYLNGELASDEQSAFDKHLAVCPQCVAFIQTYRLTVDLERAAFTSPANPAETDIVEEMPEALVQAILAAQKQRDRQ